MEYGRSLIASAGDQGMCSKITVPSLSGFQLELQTLSLAVTFLQHIALLTSLLTWCLHVKLCKCQNLQTQNKACFVLCLVPVLSGTCWVQLSLSKGDIDDPFAFRLWRSKEMNQFISCWDLIPLFSKLCYWLIPGFGLANREVHLVNDQLFISLD